MCGVLCSAVMCVLGCIWKAIKCVISCICKILKCICKAIWYIISCKPCRKGVANEGGSEHNSMSHDLEGTFCKIISKSLFLLHIINRIICNKQQHIFLFLIYHKLLSIYPFFERLNQLNNILSIGGASEIYDLELEEYQPNSQSLDRTDRDLKHKEVDSSSDATEASNQIG